MCNCCVQFLHATRCNNCWHSSCSYCSVLHAIIVRKTTALGVIDTMLPPRAGASIPIPSGRSLRPVKNRGKRNLLCSALAIMICSQCTTFDQLFLRKVIKTDATRCLDLSTKCTKMRLSAELRPDPLGELTALPRSHTWIQGVLLLRGREGECAQFCI